MSEKQQHKQIFTLTQVAKSIRTTLNKRYGNAYWIKAELHKLNLYKHSGHCYPELVEKDGGKITAQLGATLWKNDFDKINQQFINILNEPLKDGIKILLYGRINFDPIHGLSLRILDIDPSFTLGDLEKDKQDCIKLLHKEGLFFQNKMLKMPLLPQRIAIISVETSKGYADFLRIIDHNPWHYRFFCMLFPALLQGDKAVASIIHRLHQIQHVKHHFDIVAIIRGGGDDVGLSCYNNYLLAKEVTRFPIPILTGIGHATNETVTEMVAFANEITPSKLAESLIQHFHNFSVRVDEAAEKINRLTKQEVQHSNQACSYVLQKLRSNASQSLIMQRSNLKELSRALGREALLYGRQIKNFVLKHEEKKLAAQTTNTLSANNNEIAFLHEAVSASAIAKIKQDNNELSLFQSKADQLHPKNVLKRGYSITRFQGKAIKNREHIQEGDILHTTLLEGNISSKAINNNHDDE